MGRLSGAAALVCSFLKDICLLVLWYPTSYPHILKSFSSLLYCIDFKAVWWSVIQTACGWSYLFFQWGQTGWHFLQHHRRHLLPDKSEKTCAVLWGRCVRQFSPVSRKTSPLKNTARLASTCFVCQKWHIVHQISFKHACYILCSILNEQKIVVEYYH